MKRVNPWFQLRNYILEDCIKECEKGDNQMLEELLQICQNPFEEEKYGEEIVNKYSKVVDERGYDIKVSCSS